jgi:hypothetical protein
MLKITDITGRESVDELRTLLALTHKDKRKELIRQTVEACKRERPGEQIKSVMCDVAVWAGISVAGVYRAVKK